MASVSKYQLRDGTVRWQARWRDPTGVQRKAKGFRTRREASQYAARTETEMATGDYRDPRAAVGVTVAMVYQGWMDSALDARPSTRRNRRYTWENHIEPTFGEWPVASLRPSHVRRWVRSMEQAGAKAGTRRAALAILRGVCRSAVEDQLIRVDPTAGIRVDRPAKRDHPTLEPAQVQRLAEECGPKWRAAVLLAGVLGLRAGEVAGLRVESVDYLRRVLTIDRAVGRAAGEAATLGPTKTGRSRQLAIPRSLLPELAVLAESKPPSAFLVGSGDRPIIHSNFRTRVFAPAVARLAATDPAFEGLRFHDLRSVAISNALRAGVDLATVREMAGHSSVGVTNIYVEAHPADMRRAADVLDRALSVPSEDAETGS